MWWNCDEFSSNSESLAFLICKCRVIFILFQTRSVGCWNKALSFRLPNCDLTRIVWLPRCAGWDSGSQVSLGVRGTLGGFGRELIKTFDPHMLVRIAKMALPVSFLLDVVTLALVGSPILLAKYLASPTILGFFCSDEVLKNFHASSLFSFKVQTKILKIHFYSAKCWGPQ